MNKKVLQKILSPLLIPGIACAIQRRFWEKFQPSAWFLFHPTVFFSAQSGGRWGGLAAEPHPAIVLVDIQTPGMDRLETIRRIRSHKDRALAATPMIAVNEYMNKPLRFGEPTQAIRGMLKKE